MIELYAGLLGLGLLAIMFLRFSMRSRPLADNPSGVPRREAQREFYRQRSAELLSEHQQGLLDQTQFQELTLELERQLLAETGDDVPTASANGRSYWIPLALLMLPLMFFLYQQLAHRQDLELLAIQAEFQQAESVGAQDWTRIEGRAIAALAQRPDSVEHLLLMTSIMRQQGNFRAAIPYYERLQLLFPGDADALAQLGQAKYMAADRRMSTDVEVLLRRSLAINPLQATALGVLGIDAFSRAQYSEAITHWQQLLNALPPGSRQAELIQSGIEQARQRGGVAAPAVAVVGRALAVDIEIAPSLGPVPQGVLFVVAKAVDGSPMPVAARRIALTEVNWPVQIKLVDADVIRPGKTLADFPELLVSAHISLGGTAIRREGDWVSAAAIMNEKNTDTKARLTISTVY